MADFAPSIAAAYAVEGPAIDLGRGVHDGAVLAGGGRQGAPGDDEPPRPHRRRDRHGQDEDAAGLAEQLSAAGRPGLRRRREGRPLRAGRARRRRRPGGEAGRRARRAVRAGGVPGRVPRRSAASARACRSARPSPTSARSCSPRCSRPNETQEQSLALVFRYADDEGLPLLDLSDLRALLTFLDSDEGKAELNGIGGLSSADGRRAAARARRARGRRRQRVLRRAAVRHRRPAAHRARRPRRHLVPRAARACRTSRSSSRPR